MGKGEGKLMKSEEEMEDSRAAVEVWKYVFGFTEMAAVRCAIELGIADAIESCGGAATLSQLCAAIRCPEPHSLLRIMRFLVDRKIFKMAKQDQNGTTTSTYLQTPLSRRLMKGGENSMAAFILFESNPVMLAPWLALSSRVLSAGQDYCPPFEATHGQDVWGYAAANPNYSKLVDEAMACDARVALTAIITECPEVFKGVGTMVDVGGGNGTAMAMVAKAFPGIKAINFDLPHVVSSSPKWDGVEHVGGDMFRSIPSCDAAFLMKVLHDWSDSECIQILKRCREAIVAENSSALGSVKKVIIADAVIEDEEGREMGDTELSLKSVKLSLDMVMMAHTNGGKERTRSEWAHVLHEAGFLKFTIKPTSTFQSVIEAFP